MLLIPQVTFMLLIPQATFMLLIPPGYLHVANILRLPADYPQVTFSSFPSNIVEIMLLSVASILVHEQGAPWQSVTTKTPCLFASKAR
jgi:hypothetical protein